MYGHGEPMGGIRLEVSWSDLMEFSFADQMTFAGKRNFTLNCAVYDSAADAMLDVYSGFLIGDGATQYFLQ